jgi:hypothetical protein
MIPQRRRLSWAKYTQPFPHRKKLWPTKWQVANSPAINICPLSQGIGVGLLFSGMLLLASAPSRALAQENARPAPLDLEVEGTRPALRLSAGIDLFRAPGTVVVNGRYGGTWGARLGLWVREGSDIQPHAPHALVGADYMLTFWKKLRGGAGVAWIDEVNNKNGTHWNFDFTVAYDLSERVFVEYRHQSHGAEVGIADGRPNDGWNTIGAGYAF